MAIDWHESGVWIMYTKDGAHAADNWFITAYSCRADFVRNVNRPWSVLATQGYLPINHTKKPI